MADKTFSLEIVTPARVVYSQAVDFVSAIASDGSIGILANHSPLITNLGIGVLRAELKGNVDQVAVAGGFMEVKDNKVTILANAAETVDQIDVLRAQESKERAERRLAQKTADIDLMRAEASLKRALNRLELAGKK